MKFAKLFVFFCIGFFLSSIIVLAADFKPAPVNSSQYGKPISRVPLGAGNRSSHRLDRPDLLQQERASLARAKAQRK